MASFPPPNSGSWTTGLCGCSEDCNSTCLTLWVPCMAVGWIVNILDQGETSPSAGCMICCCIEAWTGCGCVYTLMYRGKLRQKFGLPEQPLPDFLTECCCTLCSICQVYRELKNRNLDPVLGYHAVKEIYERPPEVQMMQKNTY